MFKTAMSAVGIKDEKRVLRVELFSRKDATVRRKMTFIIQFRLNGDMKKTAQLTVGQSGTESLEREETDQERNWNDLVFAQHTITMNSLSSSLHHGTGKRRPAKAFD